MVFIRNVIKKRWIFRHTFLVSLDIDVGVDVDVDAKAGIALTSLLFRHTIDATPLDNAFDNALDNALDIREGKLVWLTNCFNYDVQTDFVVDS